MRHWAYYARHTFVNTIKKIFNSKVLAVFVCCILFGGILGFSAAMIGGFIGDKISSESSIFSEDEVDNEDEDAEDIGMTEHDVVMIKKGLEAVVFVAFIVIVLWGIYGGSKNGSDIFLMADVNFLFASPLKPQSVLLFRLSFQMVASLLASLYILFQLPNLVINLGLNGYAVFALIVAFVMLLVMTKMMTVFSYTITSTHERLKQYVLPFVLTVCILLALVCGNVFLATGKDIEATLDLTCCAPWTDYIPVFGWFKAMVMAAIEENVVRSLVFLGLNVVVITVFAMAIWKIKADFYEDALAGAQKRSAVTENLTEGRNQEVTEKKGIKRAKRLEKKNKYGELKGSGANAFLYKNLMNRKRFAKFGFLTNTMITYISISVLVAAALIKATEVRDIHIVGAVLAFVLFFRSFGNPIAMETAHQWLFLVPENPYKKVFYSLISGTIDCAIDLVPGLVLATIALQANPLETLIWFFALLSMDFLFSSFGIMMEALFPTNGVDAVKAMIQMILRLFVILIVFAAFGLGVFVADVIGGVAFCILFSLVFGGICFIAYPSMLHEGIG